MPLPLLTGDRRTHLLLCALVLVAFGLANASAEVSQLWGNAGEKWSPASRLPDFSFAGYRRGEEAFRVPDASISVTSFGAVGDGRTDCTAAFKQAIAAGQGKVVLIPAGRFVLSDVLEIHASNLVLRGAGPDKTVLLFQKSLETLRPRPVKNDGGTPTSDWSWGGGLIMVGERRRWPAASASLTARVTEPADRGANRLILDRPVFKVGDEVLLTVSDDTQQSLVKYLYHDQTGDISGLKQWKSRQVFRVRSVAGSQITLDRGLRFAARLAWQPTLQPFRPAVTDVGVEGLAFQFPATTYAGHFKEVGFNPVVIYASAAHCWLKNLRVWNGDNGPFIDGTFCTVQNIRLGADPQRLGPGGMNGHHGITMEGLDCLCANFTVDTQFIHDLTVQSAQGCVFCSGRAVNLSMDHHRWAPYENLYTDIDAGEGRRLFASSGGGNRGQHTAAGATFWDIRSRQPATWPKGFGPDALNLVGVTAREPSILKPDGRWLEVIPPDQLQPANLYAAMLRRRLAALKTGKN